MERVAPSQINYDDQLPIAISSKSSRREFFPEGGSTYGPNGGDKPNIVRIPINADSMLDVQNSYLKFDFKSVVNTHKIGLDLPQSFIKRLRILSGGTVLEDIDQYGRLYAGILYPAQANMEHLQSQTLCSGQSNKVSDQNTQIKHNVETQIDPAGELTFCIHLASGLLNMDKYLPLVMMNAGFTIELEFDVKGSVGVSNNAGGYDWNVSNFRYVAHLIDLERDFYDRLRMVMEGSGGVLQLAGQTFRHYSGQIGISDSNGTINIPARVKSIKSIFFKNTIEAEITLNTKYGISNSPNRNMTEYQFRIGSVVYPPNAVKCNTALATLNNGEPLLELEKAFGNLSGFDTSSYILTNGVYGTIGGLKTSAGSAGVPILNPYGLDFEAFNRSAIENGVNTSDRSLPITLDLKFGAGCDVATTLDVYVLCDAIFYVNLDGTCSVSI